MSIFIINRLGENLENKDLQQGLQLGEIALAESLKELGQTSEVIINKLMEKFGLSEAKTQNMYKY